MRVLWICNIMLPVIAKQLGMPYSNKEGWLSGLAERILDEKNSNITLGVCFPSEVKLSGKLDERDLYFESFFEDTVHEETYDAGLEEQMAQIISRFQPDLIHLFGTEYGHTLAALKAFGNSKKSLVGIQGVCHVCAECYLQGIPTKVAKRTTFRDFVKKDNLIKQQQKMEQRGEREKQALLLAGNVTGRTAFDREAVEKINNNACYYHMNETMRSVFYEGEWQLESCDAHSVFVSQGNYPIKGLHYMLRAMALLVKKYPDAHLYVAGDNITRADSLLGRLKVSSYGKYIQDLIKDNQLESHVTFLGPLDAAGMRERFLRSHVFVSASTIENSPNSVGEAMLFGVPVVSSEVGGVPDMLTNGVEGLLYPTEDADALAGAISCVFEKPELARQMSKAARERARITHDANTNYARLLEIYHDIDVNQ